MKARAFVGFSDVIDSTKIIMINDDFLLTCYHFRTKVIKYIKLHRSRWLILHIVGLCSSNIKECMAKKVKNIIFTFFLISKKNQNQTCNL